MLGINSFDSILGLCLSTAERVRNRLSDLFDGVIRISCMGRVVVSTFTTLTIGRIAEVKVLPTTIHNSLLRGEIFLSRVSEAGDVSLERNCGMVTKCLNPLCGAPFQYLRSGKVFLLNSLDHRGEGQDVRNHEVEYFWLCDSCAQKMTLNLKGLSPEVIPLPDNTEDFPSERYRGRMSIGRNSESERGATVFSARRSA